MADNEIIATARSAKRTAEAAAEAVETARRGRWPIARIGLGVGIGSAAIAAAVLYARRDRGDG